MKKILIHSTPVAPTHKIYVLEDGVIIDQVGVRQEDLSETVNLLADKYNIDNISLKGPKTYTEGIEKQIKKANITQYNNRELIFKYV